MAKKKEMTTKTKARLTVGILGIVGLIVAAIFSPLIAVGLGILGAVGFGIYGAGYLGFKLTTHLISGFREKRQDKLIFNEYVDLKREKNREIRLELKKAKLNSRRKYRNSEIEDFEYLNQVAPESVENLKVSNPAKMPSREKNQSEDLNRRY